MIDVMDKRKMFATAETLSRGSHQIGEPCGVYELYETLKMQYEANELTQDQKKIMGLQTIELL
jgi:hypothetical protein